MPLEVFFWKFDANCKTLYGHDDSGDFLNDLVIFVFDSPVFRDQYSKDCWTKNYAIEHGEGRF